MIHGDDDSVVNIRMSNEMADLIERMLPETTLKYDVARGQDHGFDLTTSLWEESFAGAALDFITKAWLY